MLIDYIKYETKENDMKCFKVLRLLALVVLILAFAGISDYIYGQAGRGVGRMRGIVIDEDGKHVANASVQIVWHQNQDIKKETRTNKKGRFAFSGLAGGNWQIFITAEGYRDKQQMAAIQQVPNNPAIKIVMKKPSVKVAVKKKSKSDTGLIEKGKQLFAEAKYNEAQEAFEKFLAKNPGYYQTYLLIGNCHKEKGEYDQALANYKKANSEQDGTDTKLMAQVHAAAGDLYIRKNDLKTAQEYFKKSLELDPKDEILAYNVGEIFFSNGKTDEAVHYFKLSSSVKPEWALPHLKIGYAYLNSEDYKNAVASFKKFLELDPQSNEAVAVKELVKSLKDL